MMQSRYMIIFTLFLVSCNAESLRTLDEPLQDTNGGVLSIFWCGFSGDFCGQSSDDDIHSRATHVILAFANVNSDGSINFDSSSKGPLTNLVNQWHGSGKKVVFSVGGQNGQWGNVFTNAQTMQKFASSAAYTLSEYNIDGIDFDLEAYQVNPFDVAHVISLTRQAFNAQFPSDHKLIVLSPECVGVYNGIGVSNSSGQAFNYWVPILNEVIDLVDLVQPQAYNNWYGQTGGSFEYLVDVYLNWLNKDSLAGHPIPSFKGVPQHKLVLGLLASTQAGGASYFAEANTLGRVGQEIQQRTGLKLGGVMLWDSHWDKQNGHALSNKALEVIG